MLRVASALVALYSFWLLLSGYFTPFLLAAGAGSALAVLLLSRRMGIVDDEGHPLHLSWLAVLAYWAWLDGQIVTSAWNVSWRILHPRLPISPTLVRFRPSQRTDLGLVIHANSITLTPSTISVEAGRSEFLVHALTAESAASLAGSEMDRRVADLEAGS